MTMRFSWDDDKAEANRRKHGILFEEAIAVFSDSLRRMGQDRIEGGEYRWQTLGLMNGVTIVLVAHTITDEWTMGTNVEHIRIISARRATRKERRSYEQDR